MIHVQHSGLMWLYKRHFRLIYGLHGLGVFLHPDCLGSILHAYIQSFLILRNRLTYSFFLNFFKETLAKELDFENEADNSVQCSTDLSDLGTLDKNGSVHVPWVDRKLTSKRVLTAEFIDGIKINQVSDIFKAYVF